MIVAFCGNATLLNAKEAEDWLQRTVLALLAEGADTFYVGGKGAFDAMAARVAQQCKRQYPLARVTLVQAYIDQKKNPDLHDDMLYPPLESVPRRFAMPRRNRYMVQAADVLVSYVWDTSGNSARIAAYARGLGKRVIAFPEIV